MSNSSATIADLIQIHEEQIVHSPAWYQQLLQAVEDLVSNDFARLVQVLYQMDVPEAKLKAMLKANPGINAAPIIAQLMLQRQLQRVKDRKQFSAGGHHFTTEEKW